MSAEREGWEGDCVEALHDGDPTVVGRYRIVGRLGSGGMGLVYLGRSPGGRAVAVKVVRPELTDERDFRRRFAREVEAARRVCGAFTAAVVDADAEGTPPWLVTAFVPGMSLSAAVDDHGPLPPISVLGLGAGIAEALRAIHAAGLVHRDLKPSNVLLSPDGARVIDFGIALAADASVLTRTGMAVGSPGFMSPEQVRGQPVGPPSDVFSLGTVLAFAATGRGPFGEGALPSLMFRIAYEAPNLDQVPDGLRDLVERCLHKEPAERPAVDALLDELAERLAKRPEQETIAQQRRAWLPETLAYTTLAHGEVALGLIGMPETAAPGDGPEMPDRAQTATDRAHAEAARILLNAKTHYEEVRARAAQAAADFETNLAKRRERTERDLAARQAKAEKLLSEVEHRAEQLRLEAEKLRTDAERLSRQTIETAQRQTDDIIADARDQANRIRAEAVAQAERLRADADAASSAVNRILNGLANKIGTARNTTGESESTPAGDIEGETTSDGEFQSFWFAVPEQRPLLDPVSDAQTAVLKPGVWYLAVGEHDDGLTVEIDGDRGVLRDTGGIQRT